MNNAPEVKIAGELGQEALRILRDIPGVTAAPQRDRSHDLVIEVGDVRQVIELKAQRDINASTARQMIAAAQPSSGSTRLIVVARVITGYARHILAEAGIGYIDGSGAISVNLPGLYIWRESRPEQKIDTNLGPGKVHLAGKAGVVTQALLNEPRQNWHIDTLAERASVSTGLVHRVVTRLEEEGLMVANGAGPKKTRQVSQPTALLDLWLEEMRDRGVQQLRAFRLARNSQSQADTMSRQLTDAGIEHALTGAAAASRIVPFVTAVPVTDVWVTELLSLTQVAAAVEAEVVREGHNINLRIAADDTPLAFRRYESGIWFADNLRILLDLRADPRRGREQADRLRQEVIGL